jgi:hypothetical protein
VRGKTYTLGLTLNTAPAAEPAALLSLRTSLRNADSISAASVPESRPMVQLPIPDMPQDNYQVYLSVIIR